MPLRSLLPGPALFAALLATLLPAPGRAEVTHFEVNGTAPYFEGRSFEGTGTWEMVHATASVALDPGAPQNAVITDIDRVPTGADGLIRLEVPVDILRPTDPARSNGRLLYEVLNRGRKLSFWLLDDVPGGVDVDTAKGGGSGFVMRQGYTRVWSGWQGDVTGGAGLGLAELPGVTGLSREEVIFANRAETTLRLSYPMADPSGTGASLTLRDREADPRRPAGFRVIDATTIAVERPETAAPGAIYEFIYPATGARAMGLGLAATREVMSFLRHHGQQWTHVAPGPEGTPTLAFGHSQSGRMLREFLNLGFNADATGARVFDGMLVSGAGSRRIFLNQRFAQPGRVSRQHEDHSYPDDGFPFSYFEATDPLSGLSGSILTACTASNTCPKLIHVDSETEAYQARASLVVTTPAGEMATLPPGVRVYFAAGTPHGATAGAQPRPLPECRYYSNTLADNPILRASLVALDQWVTAGRAPPASRTPSLADGTLVPAEALRLPRVPGLPVQPAWNAKALIDHTQMPPVEGARYPVFLPAVDADGLALGGIRLPEMVAGNGTYLGWNTRTGSAEPLDLCLTVGSYIPFAREAAYRVAVGDPRLSLEERYPVPGARQKAYAAAADALVAERLLLPEDANAMKVSLERAPGG